MDGAVLAVDDDGVAVFRHRHGALDLAGDGNAHGARHDDDVAGGSAVLQHQPAQLVARIVEQLGGAHRAGDDDGVLRQRRREHLRAAPHQLPQQPVGEVVEIAHPLAQIGVGHVQHAGAHVALHLLDRRFGRQAVADRLFQPAHPAAVVGEHAIGFEHGAMLALEGDVAARQHVVDRQASEPSDVSSRRTSSSLSSLNRLVTTMRGSCSTTWPRPTPSLNDRPVKLDRPAQVEFEPGPRQPRQIAGGDHLGDHHRRRFQRLDLVVAVVALGAVLHDQHAERAAGPQHRHAEEGIVDLFAGLRQVGEGRVLLRVGKVERPRAGRDRADQALPELELGKVDGARVQTFGGVEFERRNRRAAHRASRPRRPCSGRFRARCGRAAPAAQAASAMSSRSRLSRTRGPAARSRIGISPMRIGPAPRRWRRRPSRESNRLTTAYPDRRRNAKCEPQVPYRARRSGSKS